MKSFRRNTRGQFVVIAALLIAILTLSLVLSIHEINLHRQQLRYEPVEELVLGITSDLDRCLTHALSIATKEYNDTRSDLSAESKGYEFISKWVRSILASYSQLGLKMNINKTEVGLTDVSWTLDWGREMGLSQVYAKFDLDIDAYGFKGWVGRSGKFVMLKIFPESIKLDNQSTTLEFQIVQGKDQPMPIPNLTPESLKIWANMTKTAQIPANITQLSYLGGGIYTVTFTPRIDECTLGVEMIVITPEDNIYVSTYFNKEAGFFVTLDSQEENNASQHLGWIQLGDNSHTLPNTAPIDPGTYLLRYFAEKGYSFLNWTVMGGIHVADTNSSITSVKIDGNGTITAFYRYIPSEPTIVSLTLDSRDWENLTHHLGSITLGSTTYTPLPQDIILATGDYTLEYEPLNSSYVFLWWEFSGGVIPASSINNPTTLKVNGNGTITAVYRFKPLITTPVWVNLQSLEESLIPPGNLGKIQLGETVFELPNLTTMSSGTYFLGYIPENESYTFLNWTTTENIIVRDPYSSTTSVTINSNGSITAFYRYTPQNPMIIKLILDSRDWENLTHSLGSITLGSTTYTLPNTTDLTTGDYTVKYEPHNSSYVFLWWETIGDIILGSSISNPTTLKVSGNGTIIAVYRFKPPPATPVSINLQSMEERLTPPGNLGEILLGETTFTLPNSTTVLNGTYLLKYIPAEGYTFINWTTIGDITVANASSSVTFVAVNGDGTITAFYRGCKISLNSRHLENLSFSLGSITLGTTSYTLPRNLTGLPQGDYFLRYTPENSSYVFLWWEFSGNAIPLNSNANPTTLKVTGDGTIIAVYGSGPPITKPVSVNLQSMEETSASENLGKIRLGGTIYTLPNSITLLNGTYFLEYIPADGYTFMNWTTTENLTVGDPYSYQTSVTINGDGTITAFYRSYTPPGPTIINLTLDSRDWENLSYSLGSITLGSTTYTLPNAISLVAGDYVLQYEPLNSSYVFLWWECSGDVIAASSISNPTTLTVIGNGTVIAVYRFELPPAKPVFVNLKSLEETSASQNLGKIQLGETVFGLPNSIAVFSGNYLLGYIPADGYTFVNWTTIGDITIKDPFSSITSATISGNGTITAFYRGYKVFLGSRYWAESALTNIGKITIGTQTYTLPNNLTGLAGGDYLLQYTPHNSSYVFLWWEFSGGVIPVNSSNPTTLKIIGDGSVIAVYDFKPPITTPVLVNLRSLEETLAPPGNLGEMQLGENIFTLPNSTMVFNGIYLLEYVPAAGYTFVSWTTIGDIIVQESNSSITSVTVNGNGTITAIYRGCKVSLNSRHWTNSSYNLGMITLGTSTYTLPKSLTGLAGGDYLLQYTPHNSSYVFLWWEFSGDVIPWNSASNSTTVTIYGDGTLTAIYSLNSESPPPPPPPFVGDWSTLYVDKDYTLVPPFMWSGKSSHLPSRYSTGTGKQIANVTSPPTPTLYLARYVNVTAYVRPNPPWNAKDVTLELGFVYNGQYYWLGSGTFPVNSQGVYRLTIDILYGEFPEGYFGVIPEGSVIILTVTVTFFKEPWGTFFLYYGPNNPSRVELF